ncbi:uracil-DNA glycosylase [Candidatus Oscillochloris fontis]|uniref:uracil-DNA glycosylase n=1 Tax=Candidatus Oscillochloris fontis TaxID=2496868 RepID=UPI00101E1E4F|nr:uracil-DNA glycosylase [Candidatus Oscillochloris fontis]
MPAPTISAIISALAQLAAPHDAINPYADGGSTGNAIRRANLQRALELAVQRGPDLLVVGEAPGYNGARRTGVPFTSERILLEGSQYGATQGFAIATNDGRISAEPTATIVYREMAALNLFVVGWNAYPLHPHRPGNDQSNRQPRSAELALGLPLLAQVCTLFAGVPVLAMGKSAGRSLQQLGISHTPLRHPAQGGASQFAQGLREWCAQRGSNTGGVI